jgi:hypothetical protein
MQLAGGVRRGAKDLGSRRGGAGWRRKRAPARRQPQQPPGGASGSASERASGLWSIQAEVKGSVSGSRRVEMGRDGVAGGRMRGGSQAVPAEAHLDPVHGASTQQLRPASAREATVVGQAANGHPGVAGRSTGDTSPVNVFQGRERASAQASTRARVFKKIDDLMYQGRVDIDQCNKSIHARRIAHRTWPRVRPWTTCGFPCLVKRGWPGVSK